MTAPPLDRQRAASRTRLAQVGVIAAIACGGAILAFGLPGVKSPPSPEPLTLPTVDLGSMTEHGDEAPKVALNLGAAADRFGLIGNRPTQPVAPPPPVDQVKGTESEPPPPPPPDEDVKFLGVVHLGAMKMALISKAEKQSFLSVGGKVGDDTVSQITDSEITIGPKTIKLTPKGSDLVSRVAPAAGSGNPAIAGKPNMPNSPVTANRGNNPAMAAALAARAAAARAGNGKGTPQGSLGAPAAPFPDPVRNNRYQQLLEKFRGTGEYKSETEVAEAAMKQTDNEAVTGQLPGIDTAVLKKMHN